MSDPLVQDVVSTGNSTVSNVDVGSAAPETAPAIVLTHPCGNTFVRALAAGLLEAQELAQFYTTVSITQDSPFLNLLPRRLRAELLRRFYDIPQDKIKTRPFLEAIRLLSIRMGWDWLKRHETGWASVDAVFADLDRAIARQMSSWGGNIKGIYCYEDGALQSFQAAKDYGLSCLYDLPIGYWRAGRQIQQEEAELQPDWAKTIVAIRDSQEKLARKDRELEMADAIFVASSFTRNTLDLAPSVSAPITVIPYGAPPIAPSPRRMSPPDEPLKVLFVGSLGQRKGVSYLLDAIEQLGDRVELTLIGRPSGPCKPLEQALETYKWIESVPHSGVLAEMQQNDVLVFPSLFEGFGLVILEAMAQGLPVIATPNTAAPDICTDGKDGFIIPIRSSEAIAEKLALLDSDRDLLSQMGAAAYETATQQTWTRYGRSMVESIMTII